MIADVAHYIMCVCTRVHHRKRQLARLEEGDPKRAAAKVITAQAVDSGVGSYTRTESIGARLRLEMKSITAIMIGNATMP